MKPIEEREAKFREDVYSQALEKYPQDMLEDFCDYWSEPNRSGKRMRFEAQSFFHVKRRLATWQRNNNKWNKARKIQVNKPVMLADKMKIDYGLQ